MSMKQYREDAKNSERTTLSRNGFSPKSNEPEGMRSRSNEINRMGEGGPGKGEREARGGKIHRAKGGGVEKKMHGGAAKPRMDRFARGGHVKGKGKTTVNVVIAGQPGGQAPPRPVPVPVPAGPPPMPPQGGPAPGAMPPRPPGPPMGAPVGAMPPGAGMAPPMRKQGGRVMKRASGGTTSEEAGKIADQIISDAKPRVQKEDMPGRYDDIRKRGGKVEKDCDGGMVKRSAGGGVGGRGKDGPDAPSPHMNAGAGSGVGRMEKGGKGEPKRMSA